MWYLSLESGEQLFATKFTWVKPPRDDLVKAMCDIPDNFPVHPQNGVVRALTADMVKNATRLFPSHPQRLRMRVSQTLGFGQEALTFQRMQFATPRMALLQDSHHLIQAGFGSS